MSEGVSSPVAERRAHESRAFRGRLFDRLEDELAAAGIPGGPDDERPVTEAEIVWLPRAVQRYLRFMGVVGRSRDWSFQARVTGRFRMRPGMGWMPAEGWQYNSTISVARVFVVLVRCLSVGTVRTGRFNQLQRSTAGSRSSPAFRAPRTGSASRLAPYSLGITRMRRSLNVATVRRCRSRAQGADSPTVS